MTTTREGGGNACCTTGRSAIALLGDYHRLLVHLFPLFFETGRPTLTYILKSGRCFYHGALFYGRWRSLVLLYYTAQALRYGEVFQGKKNPCPTGKKKPLLLYYVQLSHKTQR